MVGWVDKPQIKWTHTQTAGAGNKAPYDVHGWRAHGHEFSDDNATSLLVHGDAFDVAPSFDGTADYYSKSTSGTTFEIQIPVSHRNNSHSLGKLPNRNERGQH